MTQISNLQPNTMYQQPAKALLEATVNTGQARSRRTVANVTLCDYTISATQLTSSYSDLATVGASSNIMSSAGLPFQTGMAGNLVVNLTGGTNSIAGYYSLISVDGSHNGTFDRYVNTSGGALATGAGTAYFMGPLPFIDVSDFSELTILVKAVNVVTTAGAGLTMLIQGYDPVDSVYYNQPLSATGANIPTNPSATITVPGTTGAFTQVLASYVLPNCLGDFLRVGLGCTTKYTSGGFRITIKGKG